MKKYIVGTCGNYDIEHHKGDGQVIRTSVVTKALSNELGTLNICALSYHEWEKKPISTLLKYINLIRQSKVVILFPDMRAYIPIIKCGVFFGKIFHTKVMYNVIGGWLPKYLEKKDKNIKLINKLDMLFVQTRTIKEDLQNLGVEKTKVFPNFRYRQIDNPVEYKITFPLKLVFMSRVCYNKGIDALMEVVDRINSKEIKFKLDIYGQIAKDYEEEFRICLNKYKRGIEYRGIVEEQDVSNILRSYFLHVLPTRLYSTEGYPGSILDSFYAGLPTLAARWNSFGDVICENINGLGFEYNNYMDLENKLSDIYKNPEMVCRLRQACYAEGQKFIPGNIIKTMTEEIGF